MKPIVWFITDASRELGLEIARAALACGDAVAAAACNRKALRAGRVNGLGKRGAARICLHPSRCERNPLRDSNMASGNPEQTRKILLHHGQAFGAGGVKA